MSGKAEQTPSGHAVDEATSAMQKCIRRGLEEDALYWAKELYLTDKPTAGIAWSRLRVIASEDIGLAGNACVYVQALHESYIKANDYEGNGRLFFIHAVLVCVRSLKSRVVDHALMVAFEGLQKREVPDWALDKHTKRGKMKGRGFEHFFEVGAKLNNVHPELNDLYEHKAYKIKVKGGQ